jgi:hypothetical protein
VRQQRGQELCRQAATTVVAVWLIGEGSVGRRSVVHSVVVLYSCSLSRGLLNEFLFVLRVP